MCGELLFREASLPLWGRWQPEGLTEEGSAISPKSRQSGELCRTSPDLAIARPPSPKGRALLYETPVYLCSSQMSSTAISAGLTPEILPAWPMDMGRIWASFSWASSRRPEMAE